jgi:putative flippase GtrA
VTAAYTQPGILSATARIRASVDAVYREMVKFGAVGVVAFVTDIGLFNLLRTGVLGVAGPLDGKPLTAKTVSAIVATVVAWLGNRYWTFRHRRRASRRREFVLFVLMNAGGLGIALACLGFSHYVLGLTSALADNIAGNVVGLGLGTLFRFWTYRRFVFTELPPADDAAQPATVDHPVSDIPAATIPVAGTPVADITMADIAMAEIPVAEIPVAHSPVTDSPLPSVMTVMIPEGQTVVSGAPHPVTPRNGQRLVVDVRDEALGDDVAAGMLDEDLVLAEELLAIDGVIASRHSR